MQANAPISAVYVDAPHEAFLPYAGGIAVSPGQLLFLDGGTAKPPLASTTAAQFAANFCGVASEAKRADDPPGKIRVSSGRCYRVRCDPGSYAVGELVEISPGTPPDSFKVREATANSNAIGVIHQVEYIEGNLSPVDSLEVLFFARTWGVVKFLRAWFNPLT